MGLMSIGVDTEFGGSNLNSLALSVAVEELSRGCASTGAIVSIHNCLYANLLNRKGNQHQKEKYLRPYTSGKIGAFALSELGKKIMFESSLFNNSYVYFIKMPVLMLEPCIQQLQKKEILG